MTRAVSTSPNCTGTIGSVIIPPYGPIENPAKRRYFVVDFGIDYVIIARDEVHVMDILRDVDGDFDENLAELGGAVIRELEKGQSAQVMVWDDTELCNLAEFPMGSYFSSEF